MDNYIDKFRIDINSLVNLEDVQNEIYDKVFYQFGYEEDISRLEPIDPININPLFCELDELEKRMYMSFYFNERELLEKDLNETIYVLLKILKFAGGELVCN